MGVEDSESLPTHNKKNVCYVKTSKLSTKVDRERLKAQRSYIKSVDSHIDTLVQNDFRTRKSNRMNKNENRNTGSDPSDKNSSHSRGGSYADTTGTSNTNNTASLVPSLFDQVWSRERELEAPFISGKHDYYLAKAKLRCNPLFKEENQNYFGGEAEETLALMGNPNVMALILRVMEEGLPSRSDDVTKIFYIVRDS